MTEIEQKIRQVLQEKNDKITPSNIRNGVEIFNITGTYTSDGNVTTYDIANGKIGYANGQRIIGRLPEVLENTITTTGVNFNSIVDDPNNNRFTIKIDNITERILRDNTTLETRVGYSDVNVVQNLNALGITSSNIRQGVSILGINGGLEPKGDESDATATAEDIMKDKIAYANNEKVIGTFSLDNELAEQNNIITNQENKISQLENLVTNIYSSDVNVVTADGNITNMDVMEGKIGYANGQRIIGTRKDEFVVPDGMKFAYSDSILNNGIGWNTCNVTSMSYMFYNSYYMKNINVTDWNTSNVRDVSFAFYNCVYLSNIDVKNWNTANIYNMSYLFYNCINVTDLDISSWNTINVSNMYGVFADCFKLVDIDVSNWNTANLTGLNFMFCRCNNLSDASVDSIINMCINCSSSLVQKNLSPASSGIFNATNISNTRYQNRWAELTAAGWTY